MKHIITAKQTIKIPTIDGGVFDCEAGGLIGEVFTDCDPLTVMSMVRFGTASVHQLSADTKQFQVAEKEFKDEATEPTGLKEFDDDVLTSLAAEEVHTLADAAEYYDEHGTFEPLKHIGRATNKRLVEMITQYNSDQ